MKSLLSSEPIRHIRIHDKSVGIVGLERILQAAARDGIRKTDDEIGEALLKEVEAANYVPIGVRCLYKKALIREFRVFLGESVKEEPWPELRVVVLGPGCAQCDRMERDVREVMADMRLAASLDHVADPREIARYGVMGVPALIINGKVVCVGQAPNRNKIRQWLEDAVKVG